MIDDAEILARFAMSSRHFGTNPLEAKHALFMPPDDLRLSVFRISGLEEPAVWAIGNEFVGGPQQKSIKGRADCTAVTIRSSGLDVASEPEPHERHAEVIGWPEDRTRQRLIAIRLSKSAVFRLMPQ